MENLFVTWEEFEELEAQYNLEDCGMSGQYAGYHWFQDDKAGIAVYVKDNVEE